MLKKIQDYIINEPWDDWMIRQEKILKKYVIYPFLAFASTYFLYVCIDAIRRLP